MGVVPFEAFVPRVAVELHEGSDGPVHHRQTGSLVFVDISGFTAMSERLARFGKLGAEEVTRLLDAAFTGLLSVAYDARGSLLKFGGDALLLSFTGEDHLRRAVHAAYGMRAHLRSLGALSSSAGQVRLRMSVGVHTGDLDLFLVGGTTHRELIVTGPVASHTVRMEGTASANEIVISRAVADGLRADEVGQPKGEGFLLRRDPLPELAPPSTFDPKPVVDAAHLVPPGLRPSIEGTSESEHRPATIAFVHLEDTDTLIHQHGPDEALRRLHAVVELVQRATAAHEVATISSDVDVDGAKLILAAGVPVFHDDDQERMLRTLRTIVEGQPELPLRIGTNHGRVFAGIVGPPYRSTYTVMGDTVNLAARVMAHAQPGQVLATPDVVNASRTRFATEPVEPFRAKGKTEPVHALDVGPVQGRHGRSSRGRPRLPMVGRQSELAELERRWADAAAGRGQVIGLLGPAGIGKSRLLHEFRDRVSPPVELVLPCDRYEAATPYHPIRRVLRNALGISEDQPRDQQAAQLLTGLAAVSEELLPWAPLMGLIAGIEVPETPEVAELGPQFRARRLRRTFGEFLTLVGPMPTLVRIEDVHWIDEATGELLDYLVREVLPDRPWLLVVTSRDPLEFLGEDVAALTLDALTTDDAASLARRAAELGLIDLAQVPELLERSGGHPLFLQELLEHGAAGGELPASIEASIGARIDRLPATERTVLRHAALLGQRFDLGLLRAISGHVVDEDVLSRLRDFVQLDPIRSDDGGPAYEFTHALVRDVAYEALTYQRRRELHDVAARVIENRWLGRTDEASELLAMHYYLAGRHDRAWRFNVTAAERASERFATDAAVRFYRWAIDSGRRVDIPPATLAALHGELGDTLEVLGSYDEAAKAYGQARRLASDADRLADLEFREGVVRERLGKFTGAIRWYRRAVRTIEQGGGSEVSTAVRAQIRELEVRLRQGRHGVAARAEALLEQVPPHDHPLRARAHFVCAWAHRGDRVAHLHRLEALEHYQAAGDIAGQAQVWMNAGNDAYHEGRWHDAVAHWRQAGELSQRLGDEVHHAIGVNNAGEVLSDRGSYDEAAEAFELARAVWRAAGFTLGVAVAVHNLGRLGSRRGDAEGADRDLRDAEAMFAKLGAGDYVAETIARRAELAWYRGDAAAARELARAAGQRTETQPWTRLLAARVLALTTVDEDAELARKELVAAAKRDAPTTARFEHAVLDLVLVRILDRLGDVTGAVTVAATAEAAIEQLDVRTPIAELLDGPALT